MKIKEFYDELNIPEWAASYLINDDSTGLTQDEIIMIDSYLGEFDNNGLLNIDLDLEAGSYFCNSPEFGLPCECFEGTISILIPNRDNTEQDF